MLIIRTPDFWKFESKLLMLDKILDMYPVKLNFMVNKFYLKSIHGEWILPVAGTISAKVG